MKEATKVNGQVVIPYYIKDGEVMCFDKNGKQIFIDEKDFYKKPEKKQEIQTVVPIIKIEEKKTIKTEETKKTKEEPKKTEEKKDNIIKDENYI